MQISFVISQQVLTFFDSGLVFVQKSQTCFLNEKIVLAVFVFVTLGETRCEKKTYDSHVIVTCYVEFCGNWAPELVWSCNGQSMTEGVIASTVSSKYVSSNLTVPRNTNESIITCTTRFDIKGKPEWTTSNYIPTYISNSLLAIEAKQTHSGVHDDKSSVIPFVIWILLLATAGVLLVIGIIVLIICRIVKKIVQRGAEMTKYEGLSLVV